LEEHVRTSLENPAMTEELEGMMDGLVLVLMVVTDALVGMVVLPAQECYAPRSAVTTSMSGSANK